MSTCKTKRLSSLLLLACSLLTTSKDLFGSNIHCNLDASSIDLDLFESYCFMANTFTLKPSNDSSLHHMSIGPAGLGEEDQRNYSQVAFDFDCPLQFMFSPFLQGLLSYPPTQAYYQWVSLVLVLQAGLSYLPWLAWKQAEGGKVSS